MSQIAALLGQLIRARRLQLGQSQEEAAQHLTAIAQTLELDKVATVSTIRYFESRAKSMKPGDTRGIDESWHLPILLWLKLPMALDDLALLLKYQALRVPAEVFEQRLDQIDCIAQQARTGNVHEEEIRKWILDLRGDVRQIIERAASMAGVDELPEMFSEGAADREELQIVRAEVRRLSSSVDQLLELAATTLERLAKSKQQGAGDGLKLSAVGGERI